MAENKDFAKKAFRDAVKATITPDVERSQEAFDKVMKTRGDRMLDSAAMAVGLDKMDDMSRVLLEHGHGDTLGEFMRGVIVLSFYEGWKAGRADKD